VSKKVNSGKTLLDYLFHQPIIDAEMVSNTTQLSLVSSYKLIDDFIQLGILKETTGLKRNRMFVFEEYFNLFKK
jgi:hypothetical protein